MIILFTAIFHDDVNRDRNEGFLLSVLVAPVPRAAIVGKVLGGTTLAAIQGMIFLVFAPIVGVHFTASSFVLIALNVIFLVSFALTALGFAIAWPMDSTQAFTAIINLFLIPLWLLSGALFAVESFDLDSRVMICRPFYLRRRALRTLMYPEAPSSFSFEFSLTASLLTLCSRFTFGLAFVLANRRTTKPAA